jgi:hypothetical protein
MKSRRDQKSLAFVFSIGSIVSNISQPNQIKNSRVRDTRTLREHERSSFIGQSTVSAQVGLGSDKNSRGTSCRRPWFVNQWPKKECNAQYQTHSDWSIHAATSQPEFHCHPTVWSGRVATNSISTYGPGINRFIRFVARKARLYSGMVQGLRCQARTPRSHAPRA